MAVYNIKQYAIPKKKNSKEIYIFKQLKRKKKINCHSTKISSAKQEN